MIGYNELYEILRKEKYSESLQPLSKNFIKEFKSYLDERKSLDTGNTNLFSDSIEKSKKQFENSISLFREIMLKRKKKILNLIFIATETGIMKKDYENMLSIEKDVFDSMIKAFEKGDKEVTRILNGEEEKKDKNKMILLTQDLEQFMDHEGNPIGPFKSGELLNLDSEVANILVSGGKASPVDEN